MARGDPSTDEILRSIRLRGLSHLFGQDTQAAANPRSRLMSCVCEGAIHSPPGRKKEKTINCQPSGTRFRRQQHPERPTLVLKTLSNAEINVRGCYNSKHATHGVLIWHEPGNAAPTTKQIVARLKWHYCRSSTSDEVHDTDTPVGQVRAVPGLRGNKTMTTPKMHH